MVVLANQKNEPHKHVQFGEPIFSSMPLGRVHSSYTFRTDYHSIGRWLVCAQKKQTLEQTISFLSNKERKNFRLKEEERQGRSYYHEEANANGAGKGNLE